MSTPTHPPGSPSRWAFQFSPEDAQAIARLRLSPGIEFCRDRDSVWLRGSTPPPEDSATSRQLAALPAHARFDWLTGDFLRPAGSHIPTARLPQGPWLPAITALTPEFPVAAWPARAPTPIALHLVPSPAEAPSDLVVAQLDAFARFALSAPRLRLDRLRYAANARSEVAILGVPLPPVPGTRFHLHGQVAVPAGSSWAPPVAREVLARCLAVPPGGLAIWHANNTISRIHPESILPVSRAGIRACLDALRSPP